MTATVKIDGQNLDVTIKGVGRVLSLKSQIVVPLSSIDSVEAKPLIEVKRPGFKRAGAGIPGILDAGSFGTGDDIQFWYVHRADHVLVINLLGDKYKRLVLEVPEPFEVAKEIRQAQ